MELNRYGELNPVWKNQQTCTNCGLCLKVCPGEMMNDADNPLFHAKSLPAFIEENQSATVFAAHSKNPEHRMNGASGGFTSDFLSYLLGKGLVDFCIVIIRDPEDPLKCKAVPAFTPEEVLSARGSKYAPVHYQDVIPMLESAVEKGQKAALVGLPCHLAGIAAYTKIRPAVRKSIFCSVALVCGHIPVLRAYDYILQKIHMNRYELKNIRNRGGGWPGFLSIENRQGRTWKHPYGGNLSWGRLFSSPFCTVQGCFHCTDPAGFHADISVSDAWIPPYFPGKNNPGENLVWIQNAALIPVIHQMQKEQILHLEEASFQDFIR